MNKVSIIMPAFKASETLDGSIDAVFRQVHTDWELWILVDGGDERDAAIVRLWSARDARIKAVISNKHRGVVRMRNIGLRLCKGDWYAFCDADDFWIPAKLRLQLEFAERGHLDLVYSNFYFYYPVSSEKRWVGTRLTTTGSDLLAVNSIPMSTSLVKRLPAMHYFEMLPGDQIHEDYVYWLGLFRKYPKLRSAGVEGATVYISQQPHSRSGNVFKAISSHWFVLRNYTSIHWVAACYFMLQYLVMAALKRRGRHKMGCDLEYELTQT